MMFDISKIQGDVLMYRNPINVLKWKISARV